MESDERTPGIIEERDFETKEIRYVCEMHCYKGTIPICPWPWHSRRALRTETASFDPDSLHSPKILVIQKTMWSNSQGTQRIFMWVEQPKNGI
jgi:hypothetical protein